MSNLSPLHQLEQLRKRREQAHRAGSERARHRQHERGKMLARERLAYLLDDGTFEELELLARARSGEDRDQERPYTDGVVCGWGAIDGRQVFVFSQDFTVRGGSLGEVFGRKVQRLLDLAARAGAPVIGLNDGAGARIQDGAAALAAFGEIFQRNARMSGVVPQISVIMGPCAGGAVYSPALTDFVFMVEDSSFMFITGPDVVRAVTGADVDHELLGGARTHATRSGVAHFIAHDDASCLDDVRYLLSFLPSNNAEEPPRVPTTDDPRRSTPQLVKVVPASATQPYDVSLVIEAIVDDGEFLAYSAEWAQNIVCGLARLDGSTVGIVANQPAVLAGVIDIDASEKACRFVRTCDAFNIPLITLVDVPGFLPGVDQEHGGIIRCGAKLLYAFCEATVPRLQLITRKAYGGAYIVMNSKSIGADVTYAWPGAELAVMGPEGAVEILHRSEIHNAARKAELVQDYVERFANPYIAAENGFIDDVIEPSETRAKLIAALRMLRAKREDLPRRKHGNMPV